MPQIKLKASEVDESLDNGEFPETLMEWLEAVIARMKDSPGATNDEELSLTLTNDFEPDENEEDEESEDETPKE